jgi:hypothetical protein
LLDCFANGFFLDGHLITSSRQLQQRGGG